VSRGWQQRRKWPTRWVRSRLDRGHGGIATSQHAVLPEVRGCSTSKAKAQMTARVQPDSYSKLQQWCRPQTAVTSSVLSKCAGRWHHAAAGCTMQADIQGRAARREPIHTVRKERNVWHLSFACLRTLCLPLCSLSASKALCSSLRKHQAVSWFRSTECALSRSSRDATQG
jgi:hypothetical protein